MKKPKRKRPSKLESQFRLSIKFARLEARINALEAEVLRIGKKAMYEPDSKGTAAMIDWIRNIQ